MNLLRTALLCLALVACSSRGPIHEPTPLQPIENEIRVERAWFSAVPYNSPERIYAHLQMALQDSLLYTVTSKGVLRAYDVKTGRKRWRNDLDVTVAAGIGSSEDYLLLGTAKGEVLVLGRRDGAIYWRQNVSSEILTPPALAGSLVIVRSTDGMTTALDINNGTQIWSYNSQMPALSLRGDATPVVSGDLVLLGQANGRLTALSLYDGVVMWEASIAVPQGRTDLERMVDVDATPLVVDDMIYVAAYQGRVLALSRQTGSMLWSRDLASSVTLAVDERNLYVADDDGQVWALDRKNGATLWMQDKLKYRSLTSPVAYGKVVMVADFEGYLHWMSKDNGALIARYQLDDQGLQMVPLVQDNLVYIRSKTGKLEAVRLIQKP